MARRKRLIVDKADCLGVRKWNVSFDFIGFINGLVEEDADSRSKFRQLVDDISDDSVLYTEDAPLFSNTLEGARLRAKIANLLQSLPGRIWEVADYYTEKGVVDASLITLLMTYEAPVPKEVVEQAIREHAAILDAECAKESKRRCWDHIRAIYRDVSFLETVYRDMPGSSLDDIADVKPNKILERVILKMREPRKSKLARLFNIHIAKKKNKKKFLRRKLRTKTKSKTKAKTSVKPTV